MKIYFISSLLLTAISCSQQPAEGTSSENGHATIHERTIKEDRERKAVFTPDIVDNEKDPVCGMPIKLGIRDTVHYNGKVYGFCAEGCKDAFNADRTIYEAAAEMKSKRM